MTWDWGSFLGISSLRDGHANRPSCARRPVGSIRALAADWGFCFLTARIDEIVGRGDGAADAKGGVGALLRASRIRCGEELAQVADALRIRLAYLAAIEDGRFNDLPGATYTLGFVRTYASHLGLDVDEVIRRLRVETEIQAAKPDLSFPIPVSDTTMPTGAVVMIGVVAAVVAYGAYLLGSSDDRVDVARVSPVPERMATNAGSAGAQPTNSTAATPAETPSSSTAAAVAASENAQDRIAPESPKAESPKAEPAKTEPVAAAPAPTPASAPASAPAPVAPTPTPAPAPVAQSPAAPALASDAAPQVAVLPPPAASAEPSRIEVRAKADSWIQVREGTAGAMLFTRLLRVGETYAVPDRAGLMLLTGNAGALDITVDGAAVPALGPDGAVRRSIALDAERLKTGTAAVE